VVLSALFRFRRQVPALAKALGISLLIQGSIVLFYFAVATAMGIPLPLDYCLFITPLILVAQLLPSINGFGVRESAFVFFFRTIGLSPEQAVALSFVSTGVIVLLSLAGGAIYAFRSR
ncbi:MAG: lysylphosphatidylglycerol synthase domain-containing protein, partial [Acidobacteriota bacterium]